MQTYELAYLFNPAVAEEKVHEEITKLRLMLETAGAVFSTEELPRVRGLAYEIEKKVAEKRNHYKEAYFGWFRMDLEVETLARLKKEFQSNPNILRFLLTKVIKYKPLPVRVPQLVKARSGVEGEIKVEVSDEELDKEIEGMLAPVI